jgi:hypothetical protein
MLAEDIARIEVALGIRLPDSYKSVMEAFPVPAFRGTSEVAVWDDPDRLIAYNRELRAGAPGGVKPWPPRFFALGHAGDGCPFALDLDVGDAVWWIDHSHIDNKNSTKEADSFVSWAADYFATLRREMEGEGVNPDGSPADRAAAEARSERETAVGCLIASVVVVALVFALRYLLKLWR